MRNFATITIIAAISLALATGCLQFNDDRSAIQQALPTADSVRIKVPDDQTKALGDIASYYGITRNISRDLNAGAGWVLVLVHTIVQFPATTVEGNVYNWGPHSNALDPAEWRLIVVENEDGTYDWAFDGRSKIEEQEDFTTVISGHAVPGADPHRGSGFFAIDFDAAEYVNPIDNDDSGVVEVAYDLENRDGSAATVLMTARDVETDENGNLQEVAFEYGYAENLDGSGELSFAIHGDLDDNGSAAEDALIHSKWLADGQGRADVNASGGDLGEISVLASECWDRNFRRVFYTDNLDWQPTEGEESSCASFDR